MALREGPGELLHGVPGRGAQALGAPAAGADPALAGLHRAGVLDGILKLRAQVGVLAPAQRGDSYLIHLPPKLSILPLINKYCKNFKKKFKKNLVGKKKCVPLHPLPKGRETTNKVH